MSRLEPISWRKLVHTLKGFGFEGPFQSAKHPYMIKRNLALTIPNPHSEDISVDLLSKILKQAGISKKEWISKKR